MRFLIIITLKMTHRNSQFSVNSKFGQEIKDSSHDGEEIKDLSREEIKAEEIDTRGNNDQESKKENPDQ